MTTDIGAKSKNALEFAFNLKSSDSSKLVSDLLVFSHLRWDFVFQRPQHLMTRYAKERRVYFIEEPIFEAGIASSLHVSERAGGVNIAVPHLPHGLSHAHVNEELRFLVSNLIRDEKIETFTSWYYTPMALEFTDHLRPCATIYDCMDELSAFRGAPAAMIQLEKKLMDRSDVVFTGGQSLYEAKQDRHDNIHAMPSSIDVKHFSRARSSTTVPADQAAIKGPRIGFFGVVDERFDIELVRDVAALRPDWQIVILGPVVKISHDDLPKAANIHYLGMKSYSELPDYLAGWDLAMLPFARNESTKFISPTKTPEYLAAGRPVVSTSIRDVVRPYGEAGLVEIADNAEDFVRAAELAMDRAKNDGGEWLTSVDEFLAQISWDRTHARMRELEQSARRLKDLKPVASPKSTPKSGDRSSLETSTSFGSSRSHVPVLQ